MAKPAVAEAHDEEHDAARGPHGGQCAHADPPSHDGGVDDEVHLLQEVAEDERYGELQDGACGCAACHALCVLRRGCFHVCQCFCCSLSFFSVAILSRPANLRRIFGINAGRGRKTTVPVLSALFPYGRLRDRAVFFFRPQDNSAQSGSATKQRCLVRTMRITVETASDSPGQSRSAGIG